MITFSYIPKIDEHNEFLEKFNSLENIDGIESVLCNDISVKEYKRFPLKGGHLIYFPTWLEFWKEDKKKVLEDFSNEESLKNYFGSLDKNILIEIYKEQFEMAKKLQVEYMVFHVSHVRPRDIFTFEYDYTSLEVLEESLKIINEVFKGEGPLLLFENLPWPGLTLKNYEETKYFFEKVQYEKKGFLLDFSHMICTEKKIKNYSEADKFILNKIKELKELKSKVYGVHVNGVDFNNYLDEDFGKKLEEWEKGDKIERFYLEMNHIKKIDSHKVYKGDVYRILQELSQVKYINLELNISSVSQINETVKSQLKYLIK